MVLLVVDTAYMEKEWCHHFLDGQVAIALFDLKRVFNIFALLEWFRRDPLHNKS